MCALMKNNYCKLPIGIFFIAISIASLVYTPFDLIYNIRLRMIPGTPPFQLWLNPPDNMLMEVYIFNITNSERFLNGSDDNLELQEIGPIIFMEKLTHSNVVFNENSTLTYTTTRTPVYLPERNTININDTVIMPNLGVLVMAAYLYDASFFVKATVNMLINRYKSQPIVKTTIYNYLLNSTDPVLNAAKMLTGSGLLPTTNVGCLSQMYYENKHNVTVFIGPKYQHEDFFRINKYDGSESIPGFKRCQPMFTNTSEATLFPQFLKKDKVKAWKSVLCKLVEAYYTNETSTNGMSIYRYDVAFNLFNRTEPESLDCYKGNPILPNGVADISSCYRGFPFVASFPHFVDADPIVTRRLKGLNPNKNKHGSFLAVDRISGIPLSGRAVFQVNLNFNKLTGFNEQIRRFSNMYLPLSYVGYVVDSLPWYIYASLYFMSVIVPNTQFIVSMGCMVTGFLFLYFLHKDIRKNYTDKKLLPTLESIESEKFIK